MHYCLRVSNIEVCAEPHIQMTFNIIIMQSWSIPRLRAVGFSTKCYILTKGDSTEGKLSHLQQPLSWLEAWIKLWGHGWLKTVQDIWTAAFHQLQYWCTQNLKKMWKPLLVWPTENHKRHVTYSELTSLNLKNLNYYDMTVRGWEKHWGCV